VPAEFVRETVQGVEAAQAFGPGKHVGRVGEDIARGAVVLNAGRCLRPQDVGVLASLGQAEVEAIRRPRVRLVVSGDEVVAPGQPKGLHDIYDANSAMLRGLVARDGGRLQAHLRPGDDPQRIREALIAPGADVVLVSGGSSVGSEDHAPRLLAEAGELAVHGVAMRPSSPAGFGRIGETLVFLLPGNPVSSTVTFLVAVMPVLRALCGSPPRGPRPIAMTAGFDWPKPNSRREFLRARVAADGRLEIYPNQGSGVLTSMVWADGLIDNPGGKAIAAGDSVQFLPLGLLLQ